MLIKERFGIMKKIVLKKPASKQKKGPVTVRVARDFPQLKTRKIENPGKTAISTTSTLDELQRPHMFKFYCVRCGQKLEAQVDWAGTEVACTTCSKQIMIPKPL